MSKERFASPLELSLRKILKDDFDRASAIWAVRPYDWGPVKTSEGEIIDPKKNCTFMGVAKLGPKNYAYVMIFWKGCTKKPRVVRAKGYPVQVIERSPSRTKHKAYRSKLELSTK